MQTTYTYPWVEVNMCLNLQLKTWGGTESGLNHLKNPRHTHGWYIDIPCIVWNLKRKWKQWLNIGTALSVYWSASSMFSHVDNLKAIEIWRPGQSNWSARSSVGAFACTYWRGKSECAPQPEASSIKVVAGSRWPLHITSWATPSKFWCQNCI